MVTWAEVEARGSDDQWKMSVRWLKAQNEQRCGEEKKGGAENRKKGEENRKRGEENRKMGEEKRKKCTLGPLYVRPVLATLAASDWSVVIISTLSFSLTRSRGEYLRVVGIHSDG